jgi:phage terminase small subunit
MGERGRKSSAQLSSIGVGQLGALKARPDPWPGLNPREEELWHAIVNAQAVDWFSPGDEPILAAYCKAVALYERVSDECEGAPLVNEFGKANPLFKLQDMASRQMSSFAVKLRLTQSTRWTEQKAATKVKHATQANGLPWSSQAAA